MWEQIKRSFEDSLQRVAMAIGGFLPRLLALVAIIVLTLLLALIVRSLIRRLLTSVGFDERLRSWGLYLPTEGTPPGSLGGHVAQLAFWLVLLSGFLLGITVFDATVASTLSFQVLKYLPQVLAAAVIFAVGLAAARYLERSVLIGAVNLQLHSARILSIGTKWLVIILATAMSLQHLGIGGPLVVISFGILFGGIALALALAVGLGSREAVERALEKHLQQERERKRGSESEVRHL